MPQFNRIFWLAVMAILAVTPAVFAQGTVPGGSAAPPASSASTVIPHLIKFSGTFLDEQGHALKGPVGVTFSLYAQQSGGAALWMETQNVKPDASGNYTVLLGSASANGIPEELFASGEARWLGVQAEGQAEQARVLLVSVPYALKAGDAQTLGGLPASAFMQVQGTGTSAAVLLPVGTSATATSAIAPLATAVTTTTLHSPHVPVADGAFDIKDSEITDNGTNVGVGSCTPGAGFKLDVCGAANIRGALQLPSTGTANSTTKGFNSQPFDFLTSVFNGTAAANQHFRWQVEPVNPGLSTASGKLNLLFAAGAGTPAETGLSVSSKGLFTFASGQTFPGTGTITGVTAGTDLTGGGNSGKVTLNLDTTKVPLLNASNTFMGEQFLVGGLSVLGGLASISTPSSLGLVVQGSSAGLHAPIAKFGSNAPTDSNSVQIFSATHITETFQSGCLGCFVPGTQVGDGGLRVSPGQNIVFGDQFASRLALDSVGNASQPRTAGGTVKAMVSYDPSSGMIVACFNSSLSGAAATTVPCGITATRVDAGVYTLDFGFQVSDRFVSVTPISSGICGSSVCPGPTFWVQIGVPGSTQANVHFVDISYVALDTAFHLIVY